MSQICCHIAAQNRCQIYMSRTTELNYLATIPFLLAIALSVLRFTVSDYSIRIVKLWYDQVNPFVNVT